MLCGSSLIAGLSGWSLLALWPDGGSSNLVQPDQGALIWGTCTGVVCSSVLCTFPAQQLCWFSGLSGLSICSGLSGQDSSGLVRVLLGFSAQDGWC
jgi:hypothetical protein